MEQSFGEFTDSVRSKHLGKWSLLSEVQQPKSAASSKNTRTEDLFLKHLSCSFVNLALQCIDFTCQEIFALTPSRCCNTVFSKSVP